MIQEMTQETAVFVLIVAAAGWLAWRYRRRRSAQTCCGEPECPVAAEMTRELERAHDGR